MDLRRTSNALLQTDKLTVVSAADAMLQARVVDPNESAIIAGMVADAYDWFAAETGWLNHCCLLAETFQFYVPMGERHPAGFDHSRPDRAFRRHQPRRIEIPMRPVPTAANVSLVETLQSDGTYAALDASLYEVVLDLTGFASIVETSPFTPWPWFYRPTPGAFRITFTAGFGPASAVPGPLCRAIKLLAATMYNQRESTADVAATEVMYGIRALAGRYRLEPDHS